MMRILLIGNYDPNVLSMRTFADLLLTELKKRDGVEVVRLQPWRLLGRLFPRTSVGKYFGYVDTLLIFPIALFFYTRLGRFDLVYICDHSNAIYAHWIGRLPCVVTCHDVLAICSALGEISENKTRWSGRLYQRWIASGLLKARNIVCVSNETNREVDALFGVGACQTWVIPNALSYAYEPMARVDALPILQKVNLEHTPYILHVGSDAWYKNRTGVLNIAAELFRTPAFSKHKLMMVGASITPAERRQSQALNIEDRVIEGGRVEVEELRAFYSFADFLLFPSLREGFGWPILEAQACGCVVVTTNRPPLSDVGGTAAIYIDPADPAGSVLHIVEGLEARGVRVSAGHSNVSQYTLPVMIDGYLAVFHEVVKRAETGAQA